MTETTQRVTLEEFRQTFTPGEGETKENGTTLYRGATYNANPFGLSALELRPMMPTGFDAAWGWCKEPYALTWLNLEERATVSYCEGDVHVTVSPDAESFRLERVEARTFYGKPRDLDRDYRGLDAPSDDPEGIGEETETDD